MAKPKGISASEAVKHLSIIHPHSEYNSECGYCHDKEENRVAFGASTPQLTCLDYQDMIDMGWRRSGTYCYVPTNDKTCCPNITIRLDTTKFTPNKHQKQIVRRFNRFLRGEGVDLRRPKTAVAKPTAAGDGSAAAPEGSGETAAERSSPLHPSRHPPGSAVPPDLIALLAPLLQQALAAQGMEVASDAAQMAHSLRLLKPHLKKAMAKRRADKLAPSCCCVLAALQHPPLGTAEGLAATIIDAESLALAFNNAAASRKPEIGTVTAEAESMGIINFFFAEGGFLNTLEMPTWVDVRNLEDTGTHKHVHHSSTSEPVKGPPHTFRVEMCPAAFSQYSYELYRRYQMAVHHDKPEECTVEQYTRFLCNSPLLRHAYPTSSPAVVVTAGAPQFLCDALTSRLQRVMADWRADADTAEGSVDTAFFPTGDDAFSDLDVAESKVNLACGFGSFHQRYFLDDKLVAVAVVDVLPICLVGNSAIIVLSANGLYERLGCSRTFVVQSSVYLFYDPDLPHLELGKLTALREIQWVQHAMRTCPKLKYYYMGFYVHSCQKMRYKAEYAPSELLCPRTFRWQPLAECVPLLNAEKCPLLDAVASAADVENLLTERLLQAESALPHCLLYLGRRTLSNLLVLGSVSLPDELQVLVTDLTLALLTKLPPSVSNRAIVFVT